MNLLEEAWELAIPWTIDFGQKTEVFAYGGVSFFLKLRKWCIVFYQDKYVGSFLKEQAFF